MLTYPMNTLTPFESASSFIDCNSATLGAPGFSKKIAWQPMPRQPAKRLGLSDVPADAFCSRISCHVKDGIRHGMKEYCVRLRANNHVLRRRYSIPILIDTLTCTNNGKPLYTFFCRWDVFDTRKEPDPMFCFKLVLEFGKLSSSWA